MNIIINNEAYKVVSFHKILTFKKNKECILIKGKNKFNTFFQKNIDLLVINSKNAVIFRYQNMPWGKSIKVDNEKEKTSILVLPKDTSKKVKIGDVLTFESEHII